MKSLAFFKPTLATTLAIVLAWLLSVRPAQAGYTVTLQQVGPDVVATGSGSIDLTGLAFFRSTSLSPGIDLSFVSSVISTGPTSSRVDEYSNPGPLPSGFGSGGRMLGDSGSGDPVGIAIIRPNPWVTPGFFLFVPTGYVSGTALSDLAIYSGKTFATLGVTPGTYLWTWGAERTRTSRLKSYRKSYRRPTSPTSRPAPRSKPDKALLSPASSSPERALNQSWSGGSVRP